MTATRTLAKKNDENFSKKSVREGKKVENATLKSERQETRFLRTQRRGPFRIGAGFPVARVLRPAARVLKKPTFAVPNPKHETRLASASRSKLNRPSGGAGRSKERERTSFLLSLVCEFCQRGRRVRRFDFDRRERAGARQLKLGASCGARFASRSSSAASLYCLILLYIVFSLTPSLRAARRRQPLQATSVSRKAALSICGNVKPASPSDGENERSARPVERKETGRGRGGETGVGRETSATETQDSSSGALRERR